MKPQVPEKEIENKSFGHELRPGDFSIFLKSSSDIYDLRKVESIISLLNTYGIALVEFEDEETPKEQLLCFKEVLGDIMFHDRADNYGIAEVAVIDNSSVYPGISSRAYTFHTDGSYDQNPPEIVALRCQTSALSGGITQLASAKKLFDWMQSKHPDALDALFEKDALIIRRDKKFFSGSIFEKISKDRFSIRYRADEAVLEPKNEEIRYAKKLVEDFLSEKENLVEFSLKERQVLLTDNLSVLHGRTAFNPEDPRKLHRLWFNGKTSKNNRGVCVGFEISPAK